jgi:hypothetical protein
MNSVSTMQSGSLFPLAASAPATSDAGLAVIMLGTVGGLLLARAVLDRRPTGSCLRALASVLGLAVAVRIGVAATVPPSSVVYTVAQLLDAAMIAATVATLWVARARKRELDARGSYSSR